MADLLPMFPLGLVTYPSEPVNLHIFEPRYKQLIHECNHKGITFCVLPYFENLPKDYATEMRLLEIVKTYEDGKMDIRTKGVGLVRVLNLYPKHPGKLYPGAEVNRVSWDEESDLNLSVQIVALLQELYEVMNITNVPISKAESFKVYQNVHKIGLRPVDEIELLSMPKEVDRQYFILDHLKRFLPIMTEANELRRKAALNGHFKNLKSRF